METPAPRYGSVLVTLAAAQQASTFVLALTTLLLPPTVSAQAPDTVCMRLAWEVAEGGHPPAGSLGELSCVAVDRCGNAYVSDFSATKIWVFDANARSVTGIGRKDRATRSPCGRRRCCLSWAGLRSASIARQARTRSFAFCRG